MYIIINRHSAGTASSNKRKEEKENATDCHVWWFFSYIYFFAK